MKSQPKLFRAFCNLTGVKTGKKLSLTSIRKDVSLWNLSSESRLFKMPTAKPKENDCHEIESFLPYVKPSEFSPDISGALGDYDVPPGHEALRDPKSYAANLLPGIMKSSPSLFVNPLVSSVQVIAQEKGRSERVHEGLISAIMQASGFVPVNGFNLSDHRNHLNKLTMEFNGKQIVAILDWALWTNETAIRVKYPDLEIEIGRKLLLHATEIKLDPDEFHYAQLLGQCLLHANYNFHNSVHLEDDNNSFTAHCLALSGWNVRVLTVKFARDYLESINNGVVPDIPPECRLSKSYCLLKLEDRKKIVGHFLGRYLALTSSLGFRQ